MKKLNGTVIVTYRCNARCNMCNRYKKPSKPEEELTVETIKKLPQMYFTNITGGEPFIREDLGDIVRELYKKSDRIVISTNGFFTDRIIKLCEEFPNVGIRISIEGLEETNNKIRGLEDGFNKGYTTLKKLVEMNHPDVGFGMTVQDENAKDLVELYKLSDKMNMEFATASLHNSFYFVEAKNIIKDRPMVAKEFEGLINELLKSNSPKKWFRAYFNHGLINYIYGQKRLLPCDMAFDTFFIDPYGDVMPCNGTKEKEVMGNLNETDWDTLWNSEQADRVREKVRHCDRQCWMIGSVSPAMHKYIWVPAAWVIKHKFLRFFKENKYSMYENKICRDYRDGKVTKAELDKLSTCDINAQINDVMLCQPVCLFQHILHGDAAVRATDGRDGAVGTVVGTALGDFQIGEKRQGGDNAVTLHFGIALLAETHHTLAGENVVENIHNVPVVADADNSICLCEQLRRLFFIALGETSGEDDLFQRAVFFQRTQFQDGLNGFFFGGLNESAGVDNGNFRLAGLCHKLIAVRTQLCQHTLGIYQILGTSQRNHAYTNWHIFSSI